MTLYNTLKQLCLCPSVSGREEKIRNMLSDMVAPFCDEVKTDKLGTLRVRIKEERSFEK